MNRRGFLAGLGIGTGALATSGWFGFEAKSASTQIIGEVKPSLHEEEELWYLGSLREVQKVTKIQMRVPYDHPTVVFQMGSGNRLVVPRSNEEELRYDPRHNETSLPELLKKRMTQVLDQWKSIAKRQPEPMHLQDPSYALCLIVDCPRGIEYGIALCGEDIFHKKYMHIMTPAHLLFG